MYLDDVLTNIVTAVKAVTDFKSVEYGMRLPDEADKRLLVNTPCVFFWGGTAEYSFTESIGVERYITAERTISIYLFYHSTGKQSTALSTLDGLRDKLLNAVLRSDNGGYIDMTSIKEDRTTTFMNVGAFFNMLPPFYCTRIDLTLRDEQSSF